MTDTTDINIDYLTPISEQSDRSVPRHYIGYTRAHSPLANGYAKGKRIRGHLVNGDGNSDITVSRENFANGDDKRSTKRHQLINGHARSKSLPVHSANGGVRSERLQAPLTNDDPGIETSHAHYVDGSSGGTNVQTDRRAVANGYQGLMRDNDDPDNLPYATFNNDESQYTFGGIPKGVTPGLGKIKPNPSLSTHSKNYEQEGVYNEVYDEIDDIEPYIPSTSSNSTPSNSTPSNSTRSKSRCYLIAFASVLVTIVLAGATFAVVFFLEIKSSKPPVDIEEPDYTFNIGEPGNLTFEITNLTDWTELYISREFTVPVASANRTSPHVEIAKTHGHISALNTTELSNHYVRIDLLFATVSCNDSAGKAGIVTYVCSIKMTDLTWINVMKRIRFQRLPGVPKLTMSREIIKNKVTRADLLYVCEGELGDPRGRLIIESDFDGEFQALFTEENTNNSIGFIFDDPLTQTSCGNYQTLQFAFYKPNMSMNFKRLRCSIKPSSNIFNSVVKSSGEGIIKVVPDDWCKGATKETPIIDHPYACYLGVMCSEVGIVQGVPAGCSEDQCYSTLNMAYGCYPCKCAKGGPLPAATTTSVPNGK
ncbi:uncharacterized protein LOC127857535 isoform X2 [Dreissena polymorpha]|uniref:uncharacterized protein LOC127857535 isoform X2 n=1 Tax=Dreissena polymorpha TaxID=45954 RepID=UPI002264F384|nr:uncharacterized protein LOC127857535 isoform X2 [Dreissena polymorpha]